MTCSSSSPAPRIRRLFALIVGGLLFIFASGAQASIPGANAPAMRAQTHLTFVLSDPLRVRTDPAGPTVTTGAASNVAVSGATVSGTVNPNGVSTKYQFQYGTTVVYGSTTTLADAGSGTADVPASAPLGSLTANTLYHYRLIAVSGGVTYTGSDKTFTTLTPDPTVTTGGISTIGVTTATITGAINPNGFATSYRFEYGTTNAYGSSTSTVSAGAGTANFAISAALSSLTGDTTYHYRLVGVRGTQTFPSADRQFTTLVVAPSVTTQGASSIGLSTATIAGTVNPNGFATSYYFEYGTTGSYGSSTAVGDAGAGTGTIGVSASLSGLTAGTTYHYRVVALRQGVIAATGADKTFTTVASATVVTGGMSTIGATTATVTGTVNPGGVQTSYRFDYGPTNSYGSSTAANSAGAGSTNVAVSATLADLSADTTYHYRVVALRDGVAVANGADRTFQTLVSAPIVTPPARGTSRCRRRRSAAA